jgi:F-type H+-transporting ATPase subunit a
MLFIVFSYLAFGKILSTHYSDILPYKNVIKAFWSSFNIDCMTIGGIFAILPFAFSIIMTGFELFVAVLQAYIFAILVCAYLSETMKAH